MRWPIITWVSLGVNLALASLLLLLGRDAPRRGGPDTAMAAEASSATRTNVVVRRQLFSWKEVESPDYATYIANLRQIGCPEQTIRDIIIADVNSMYSRRRAMELVTSEQQWWRSEPDAAVVQEANQRAAALEEERRGLLTSLLGTNWESGDMISLPRPTRPGIILDGPVLGALPADAKQAVQEIAGHSQDRLQAYYEAQIRAGKNIDPAVVARMRIQMREDLARVLSPAQLEEYLLRYSQNANGLRSEFGQLQFFNPSPDEFRNVFRVTDPIDQQLSTITGTDSASNLARKGLEEQRENAIKTTLGPERYQQYRQLQDPLYREAMAQAVEAGTPEAAETIYEVNLAAAAERASINIDTNLTASQRSLALKQLELEQMTANTLASGQEPLPGPPAMPPQIPRRTYVLHPGDNLALVATLYGIPISAIRQANPGLNLSRLKPGDAIVIPPAARPPATAP